jgi:hypothetical protein
MKSYAQGDESLICFIQSHEFKFRIPVKTAIQLFLAEKYLVPFGGIYHIPCIDPATKLKVVVFIAIVVDSPDLVCINANAKFCMLVQHFRVNYVVV